MSRKTVLRQTSGIAGAIRVYWGDPAYLERMERHGKLLDPTSRARAESYMLEQRGYFDPEELPAPVSTTGLELQALYEQHLGNKHRDRRSEGRFLHLIVQFPTELVDGENPEWMLAQARQFSEAVFGPRAIFADRVDRHETGRHTVDIFVAPLVEKKTKRTSKLALSLTKGMDELCKSLDIKPTRGGPQGLLKAYGKALQTAWYNHLLAAGVEGVVRGEEKESIDPDRVSPEVYKVRKERELRQKEAEAWEAWAAKELENLEAEKANLERQRAENAQLAAELEAERARVQNLSAAIEAELDGVKMVGRQAVADWAEAEAAKDEAEVLKASAQAELKSAAAERVQAKLDRGMAAKAKQDAELARTSAEIELAKAKDASATAAKALAGANAEKSAAEALKSAAEKARKEADADKAAAASAMARIAANQAAVTLAKKQAEAARDEATSALENINQQKAAAAAELANAASERAKAKAELAAAEKANLKAQGILKALELWVARKLRAISDNGDKDWEWHDKSAAQAFSELVRNGGLEAWHAVRTAASSLAKRVREALTPEERAKAAVHFVKPQDIADCMSAMTIAEVEAKVAAVSARAPIKNASGDPPRLSPEAQQALNRLKAGKGGIGR